MINCFFLEKFKRILLNLCWFFFEFESDRVYFLFEHQFSNWPCGMAILYTILLKFISPSYLFILWLEIEYIFVFSSFRIWLIFFLVYENIFDKVTTKNNEKYKCFPLAIFLSYSASIQQVHQVIVFTSVFLIIKILF